MLFTLRLMNQLCRSCMHSYYQNHTYVEMLQIIFTKDHGLGYPLDPITVMMDFELSMMNVIHRVFGQHVVVKSWNTWKHIQQLGLVNDYRNNDDFKHFCGMLDGLAFRPVALIPQAMQYLIQHTPNGFVDLVEYFDRMYVSSTFCRIARPSQNAVL